MNSTRHFMRELNRLGLTSIIDAGGGFQNYPEDYAIIDEFHRKGEMTVRIAYNLFTQKPKQEKEDFARWIKMTGPGKGDDFFRCNGAGEMLVFSAADFEDFLEPRPDLNSSLEGELKDVVSLLAVNKWPFRLHATYDESITRFLNVFEEVNRDTPFKGLNWFFDHCETVSDRNLNRIKALGGGIAIQHRMAYQGEYFMDRYGKKAAKRTPPVRKMLELYQKQEAGEHPVILDLRQQVELELNPSVIRGAFHMTTDEVEHRHQEIPRDRDIVLYCSCPNEVTSARVALHLYRKGISRATPLLGGIEAWRERKYPTELPEPGAEHARNSE
jgi:rhodanese-related sulfurtransferase